MPNVNPFAVCGAVKARAKEEGKPFGHAKWKRCVKKVGQKKKRHRKHKKKK